MTPQIPASVPQQAFRVPGTPTQQGRPRKKREREPREPRSQFEERILRKYDLTREAYDFLVLRSEGRCEICAKVTDLVIDHCHTSGRVRGLLCMLCNTRLGVIENNPVPDIFQRMIRYLEVGNHALLT